MSIPSFRAIYRFIENSLLILLPKSVPLQVTSRLKLTKHPSIPFSPVVCVDILPYGRRRSFQNFTSYPHHEATTNDEESGKLDGSLGSLPGLTFPSNNHKLTPVTPKACLDKPILDRMRIGKRSAMNCELKLTKQTNLIY